MLARSRRRCSSPPAAATTTRRARRDGDQTTRRDADARPRRQRHDPGSINGGRRPRATANTPAPADADWRQQDVRAEPPMTIDENKKYFATIKMDIGDIKLELFPKDAPQTVNSFVFLARDGYYDGVTFHRVHPGLRRAGRRSDGHRPRRPRLHHPGRGELAASSSTARSAWRRRPRRTPAAASGSSTTRRSRARRRLHRLRSDRRRARRARQDHAARSRSRDDAGTVINTIEIEEQ